MWECKEGGEKWRYKMTTIPILHNPDAWECEPEAGGTVLIADWHLTCQFENPSSETKLGDKVLQSI